MKGINVNVNDGIDEEEQEEEEEQKSLYLVIKNEGDWFHPLLEGLDQLKDRQCGGLLATIALLEIFEDSGLLEDTTVAKQAAADRLEEDYGIEVSLDEEDAGEYAEEEEDVAEEDANEDEEYDDIFGGDEQEEVETTEAF